MTDQDKAVIAGLLHMISKGHPFTKDQCVEAGKLAYQCTEELLRERGHPVAFPALTDKEFEFLHANLGTSEHRPVELCKPESPVWQPHLDTCLRRSWLVAMPTEPPLFYITQLGIAVVTEHLKKRSQ